LDHSQNRGQGKEKWGKNKEELLERGFELFQRGSYQAALLYFDDALELDPNNSQIWDLRGVSLSHLGLMDEAQESFEVALDIKPDNAQAWSNLGILYASQGRFEEAVNSFDHSLELEKANDEVWNNKGSALFGLKNIKRPVIPSLKPRDQSP
jgi:Flp pilus assembly protein TadD